MDIAMVMEDVKYNFRVGAVLTYQNKILIEKSDASSFFVIPGGRVKLLEDTKSALIRELKEELGIDISKIDSQLISVIENFFVLRDVQFHELYFIYKYDLTEDFGIKDGMVNLDSSSSKYYWKSLDELDNIEILPIKLKEVAKLSSFKKYVVRNWLNIKKKQH